MGRTVNLPNKDVRYAYEVDFLLSTLTKVNTGQVYRCDNTAYVSGCMTIKKILIKHL